MQSDSSKIWTLNSCPIPSMLMTIIPDTHTHTYIHTHTHTHTYIYIYIYIYGCVFVRVNYRYRFIHAYTQHTNKYTHIYIRNNMYKILNNHYWRLLDESNRNNERREYPVAVERKTITALRDDVIQKTFNTKRAFPPWNILLIVTK